MNSPLSAKHAASLFLGALLIRACVMLFVIQPHGYYKQADSSDYHNCSLSIATGHGMHRIDTKEPIFWRTPGYPPFLALFYYLFGIQSWEFDKNSLAQCTALWMQILCASFIPIILFYLAYVLTHTISIATILGWIAVFHPGLVLASTYLLTEGLALIFFYLFLLFVYKNLVGTHGSYISIIAAAFSLGIYTWMRPMGEFIAYFTSILIFIAGIGTWKTTTKKALLFFLIFVASIFPWYWRNYKLTGEWFFCPTIGNYLNCFTVPKILHRTSGKPLIECHKIAQQAAAYEVYKKRQSLFGTGLHVSPAACKNSALPIVMNHPWYFAYEWLAEVTKTTFDLYSYQLIPMLDNSYWYDPLEEFLPEKIAEALYTHRMPWYVRIVCWAEFLCAFFLWIGLFAGLWAFVMRFIITPTKQSTFAKNMARVWLICIPMIGIIIGMTGGFGYARLRLPAEPLMIILSFTFWVWFKRRKMK